MDVNNLYNNIKIQRNIGKMVNKSSEMYRLSNNPVGSVSMITVEEPRNKSNQTRKKVQTSSKYSNSLDKTTSMYSYKNSIRKSDFFTTSFPQKLKIPTKEKHQRIKKCTARKLSKDSFPKQHSAKFGKNINLKNTGGSSVDDYEKKSFYASAIYVDDDFFVPFHSKNNSNLEHTYQKTCQLLSKYQIKCQKLRKQKIQYKKKYFSAANQLKNLRNSMVKRI